jgi:hypothetical protein
MRQAKMRPLIDDFFAWAHTVFNSVKGERGLVSTAFGYVVRQELALRRFLDDGRLVMTNNASERALRSVAVGRKNWLFFGSDDHASAAANLFSLIASCRLHGLDPEQYLFEIIRVLPYWPQPRLLELILPRRRPRWTVEDARTLVAALHRSGKSVSAFAAEHSIDPQRVYLWRRRFAGCAPH